MQHQLQPPPTEPPSALLHLHLHLQPTAAAVVAATTPRSRQHRRLLDSTPSEAGHHHVVNCPVIRQRYPRSSQRHHAGRPHPASPSSPVPASDDELLSPLLSPPPPPSPPPPLPRRRFNMSSPASSSAEKPSRRVRTTGHVLRAGGPASTSKQHQSHSSANMPAPPPKAAMSTATASTNSPDEALESSTMGGNGGAPLKDKHEREKDGVRTEMRTKDAASTSDAANALLLRERDERIANLENELAIMEREFTRELDNMSRNESETATFWQAKHSTLHQQFLRADTDLRLLRNEVEARERERDELRSGWEALRRTLAERDGETRALRAQVRGLKEFVSTSTRTDGQQAATDESLAEAMAKLANGLQNWVITNFRKAKLRSIEELDETVREQAEGLLPMFEDLVSRGSKVHLLQSIVSQVLVDEIFEAYYAGLSKDQTTQFRDMEINLASFASEEAVNQWRASTLALVHRDAATHLQDETASLVESLSSRILQFLDSILQANSSTTPSAPDTRDISLRHLIASSIDLSRLLAVQRAAFSVHMPTIEPHQRVLFDTATMEDVGGEDEDALLEREISCVVFPGLVKQGDESGGHLKVYRNVIAKARVLCAPEA